MMLLIMLCHCYHVLCICLMKVQWEPPDEPDYILVDTEDEGSGLDDPNRVSIRKNRKWSKKGNDITEADLDKITKTPEELFVTSNEKDGKSVEKERPYEECTSEKNALKQKMPEVEEEERSGEPEHDDGVVEPCRIALASDARHYLPDTLEKLHFKTEIDVIDVDTKNQCVNLEVE